MSPGGFPPPALGLCAACAHHRVIENRRGSRFHLCERARTDPRFRKYPPLPVLRCEGFEPRAEHGHGDTRGDAGAGEHEP